MARSRGQRCCSALIGHSGAARGATVTRLYARVPVSLPANPRVLWRIKIGEGFAPPVVAGGKVFYFDNQQDKETLYGLGPAKNLICVEAATGKITWSKDGYFNTAPNAAYASLLAFGKNILVCTDGGQLILIAADPTECREINRAQVCGLNWCSPAYADGRLYVRDGIKTAGNLYCLELLP